MKELDRQLTDEQWQLIESLFPAKEPSPKGGRPPAPTRDCVEGILWILRTGARWKDLPRCFPSPTTCWRRFREWTEAGIWKEAWARLLRKLDRRGEIDWSESMADGTFASAKKGAIA
jgi:transposase